MSLDEGISSFISRIYESASDWTAWDGVARTLLELTHGHALFVSTVDTKRHDYSSGTFYGPDTSASLTGLEEFWGGLYDSDPSLAWAADNPRARFCDMRNVLPKEGYLDFPYIKWNKSRFGSTHWFIGYTAPDDGLTFGVSLHPHWTVGPPHPRDERLFRMLFEHMDCAVRLAARPPDLGASDDALIFLNRLCEVVVISAAAEALLAVGDGIALRDRRLHAACKTASAPLQQAISSAINALREGGHGGSVRLPCVRGQDLIAIVSPIKGPSAPCEAYRPAVMVRLVDQAKRPTVSRRQAEFFQLSSREIEVANLLLAGHSPHSIAQVLGISVATVRIHLRSLFRKTQTGRQSELLRVLMAA